MVPSATWIILLTRWTLLFSRGNNRSQLPKSCRVTSQCVWFLCFWWLSCGNMISWDGGVVSLVLLWLSVTIRARFAFEHVYSLLLLQSHHTFLHTVSVGWVGNILLVMSPSITKFSTWRMSTTTFRRKSAASTQPIILCRLNVHSWKLHAYTGMFFFNAFVDIASPLNSFDSTKLNSTHFNSTRFDSTQLSTIPLTSTESTSGQSNSTQFNSTQINTAQLSSIEFKPIHFNSTRNARLNSTQCK